MSTIKVNEIQNVAGSSLLTSSGTSASGPVMGQFGFKNRIINGDMRIDQRNNGASVTIPAALTYTLDRWQGQSDQASKYSVQRSETSTAGFINSLLATSLSAYTVLSGDRFVIRQNIEGFNVADLGWGTANAQPITVSFWVRSSLTGSFGAYVGNSALDRSYPFSYTINSANTFEYKTITIPGDTTGTWLTDNGVGVRLGFSLGVGSTFTGTANTWASSQILAPTGSVSLVGTNGATWYVTGVQLEKGTVATPFEFRSIGQELALCQRYFETSFPLGSAVGNGVTSIDRKIGAAYSIGDIGSIFYFCVPKRATPTIVLYRGQAQATNNRWGYFNGTSWVAMTNNTAAATNNLGFGLDCTASGRTFGQALLLDGNWTASAEL